MDQIYIIGGANIDIFGKAKHKINLHDSNIGNIEYCFGGVARNIAENLTRLDHPVKLITVLADDIFGKMLKEHCDSLNIDLSLSLTTSKSTSSTYLALLDEHNDLLVGMADMQILKALTTSYLKEIIDKIAFNDVVVLDTNLDKETINFVLTKLGAPVFVDPISMVKAEKLRDELKHIYMLKPNRYEAESLSGIKITDANSAYMVLEYFLSHGVKEIVITLGVDGVLASDGKQYLWAHSKKVSTINATGAGDSFVAGYIDGYLKKQDLKAKLISAMALAELTLVSSQTVNEKLDQISFINSINESTIYFEEL